MARVLLVVSVVDAFTVYSREALSFIESGLVVGSGRRVRLGNDPAPLDFFAVDILGIFVAVFPQRVLVLFAYLFDPGNIN
jgi:hypothetical protein